MRFLIRAYIKESKLLKANGSLLCGPLESFTIINRSTIRSINKKTLTFYRSLFIHFISDQCIMGSSSFGLKISKDPEKKGSIYSERFAFLTSWPH